MTKRIKIITIAAMAALSMTTTCFATIPTTKSTPRHSHGKESKIMAVQHNSMSNALSALKAHDRAVTRSAFQDTHTRRATVSRDGLNKTRAAQISKIVSIQAESVKKRIKKIPTTTQYSEEQRDKDSRQVDAIKTDFIKQQNG